MPIRYAIPTIILVGLAVLLGSVPSVQAQSPQAIASDEATDYNDWSGDPSLNEGDGFQAWTFDENAGSGNAGRYLGSTAGGAIDPGVGLFSGGDTKAF